MRTLPILSILALLLFTGCDSGTTEEGELIIEDLVVGEGAVAERGMRLTVHYVGELESGEVFDSSYDRDQPLEFILGVTNLIEGWQQGLPGMRVGGTRRLTIPPHLAYGSRGQGCQGGSCAIPPNSTLIFTIELLDVTTPEATAP